MKRGMPKNRVQFESAYCACVCAKSLQSCPTLQPYGLYVAHQAPSVHGILQARILERVALPFSRGFLTQ